MLNRLLPAALGALAGTPALAADPPPEPPGSEIVVYGRGLQQVGRATSGSEGTIGYADFEQRS